jgi:hypothetical protein
VQLFQAHFTVVPTVTVFVPGENASFVTEIPPVGVVVFPGGGLLLFGAVELDPPEPPHAQTAATVSATKTAFIVIPLGNRVPKRGIRPRSAQQA